MFELEDIIKLTSLYLTAKDKKLKYIYCNENVACALGLDSPKKIIGKTDYDLYKENIAHTFRAGDIHILKGGTLLNVYEIHPNISRTMQILTTKHPLKDKRGCLAGVVVSYVDITDLNYKSPPEAIQYDSVNNLYKIQMDKEIVYLTTREHDVLKNILKGFTAKRIARELLLSHRTIEDYIERIKSKFRCINKHQIIEVAINLGIIQKVL